MEQLAPQFIDPVSAYRDLHEQCVIESSFLWILRAVAIQQPHYAIQDIQELEQRIDSWLDGIMTSLSDGWLACESALELEEPGEVFTATVIAFRSREMTNIQKAVEVGLTNDETIKGLISAIGWLPDHLANPWIERFLKGKDLKHKYLGLAAASVRRQDPGDILTSILQREDCRQNEKLYARAVRLIGELGRQDLLPALSVAIKSDSNDIKFWAIWSAIMLGNKHVATQLEPYVFEVNPHHERAVQLAFRVLPIEMARKWISKMAKNDDLDRSVIKATGILGDPHPINWLITKMAEPEFSRLAGESFSLITGLDLEQNGLSMEPFDDEIDIPEDSDENLLMDEDENLPWPNVKKVATIWQAYGKNFIIGQRHFLGGPITPELLKSTLVSGFQRQRHAAALELALTGSDGALINTRAKVSA